MHLWLVQKDHLGSLESMASVEPQVSQPATVVSPALSREFRTCGQPGPRKTAKFSKNPKWARGCSPFEVVWTEGKGHAEVTEQLERADLRWGVLSRVEPKLRVRQTGWHFSRPRAPPLTTPPLPPFPAHPLPATLSPLKFYQSVPEDSRSRYLYWCLLVEAPTPAEIWGPNAA